MRVGIVTTWFERGASYVSRQIADSLKPHADVYIYARGEKYAKGNDCWDLPNVHWGKRLHWTGSGKIDKDDFLGWLQDNEIDTLIFNEQRWWQPIIWAKHAGIKVGTYVDYYTENSVENFSAFDFLICNTKRHLSAFQWHAGAVYVPWGTDTDVFTPSAKTSAKFTFFHSCGWDGHRKGLDLVISAFDAIKVDINAELLIHTQSDISSYVQNMDKIRIILDTVSPPGLFCEGDVYVYPSRLEGIGLTICEALSCGLPVLTTKEPPMSEFIIDGYNGYLIPVRRRYHRADKYYWRQADVSIAELAEKMLEVYHMSSEELGALKRNSRQYVLEHRSWDANSKPLFSLIEGVPKLNLSVETIEVINDFDFKGWKGKLDYLLEIPPLRYLISKLVGIYRRRRQPNIYS